MELKTETRSNLNIAIGSEAIDYTYDGFSPIEVVVRVDIGSMQQPIIGGGNYSIDCYINNVLVSPASSTPVSPGVTKTIVISRPIPLRPNDTISIVVTGLPSDTAVTVTGSIRDITPVLMSEVVGTGTVLVDHNYPSSDYLTYLSPSGNGINGATIKVFRWDDYDSGNRSEIFVVARSTTVENGKWKNPVYLDPGSYTFVFSKAGLFGPDVINLTVS